MHESSEFEFSKENGRIKIYQWFHHPWDHPLEAPFCLLDLLAVSPEINIWILSEVSCGPQAMPDLFQKLFCQNLNCFWRKQQKKPEKQSRSLGVKVKVRRWRSKSFTQLKVQTKHNFLSVSILKVYIGFLSVSSLKVYTSLLTISSIHWFS